ncbi:MAG: hypothetical protein EZS28_031404 [Streblomastix strix]|uniref:Uncharacterized protein n=1 Tax=Streblomastix strix TaxID=222440 RepID=A0A5J4URI8_9EUKA|nr:MAG: hypothetical protein EZS28_031404 [Streblomastix strix]
MLSANHQFQPLEDLALARQIEDIGSVPMVACFLALMILFSFVANASRVGITPKFRTANFKACSVSQQSPASSKRLRWSAVELWMPLMCYAVISILIFPTRCKFYLRVRVNDGAAFFLFIFLDATVYLIESVSSGSPSSQRYLRNGLLHKEWLWILFDSKNVGMFGRAQTPQAIDLLIFIQSAATNPPSMRQQSSLLELGLVLRLICFY